MSKEKDLSRLKVIKLKNGEGLDLNFKEDDVFSLTCCDCGLVHGIEMVVAKNRKSLTLYFYRNDRRTAQIRRQGKRPSLLVDENEKWRMVRS